MKKACIVVNLINLIIVIGLLAYVRVALMYLNIVSFMLLMIISPIALSLLFSGISSFVGGEKLRKVLLLNLATAWVIALEIMLFNTAYLTEGAIGRIVENTAVMGNAQVSLQRAGAGDTIIGLLMFTSAAAVGTFLGNKVRGMMRGSRI